MELLSLQFGMALVVPIREIVLCKQNGDKELGIYQGGFTSTLLCTARSLETIYVETD